MAPLRGVAACFVVLVACTRSAPSWSPSERDTLRSLAAVGRPPDSPTNRWADDPRAAALGHRLFFDRGLSLAGDRACASCHDPRRAFTDGLRRARGAVELPRNTPSLIGAAWAPFLGWDGRRDSVWSQSVAPLLDAREHGLAARDVARRVAEVYRDEYQAIFGPLPGEDAALQVVVDVGKALEAYVRRLEPARAPFDAYVAALEAGDPTGGGHLSPAALRGLRIFVGRGRCVACHHGPLFTDHEFHDLGLPSDAARREDREGRAFGARAVLVDRFRCGGPFAPAADEACASLRFLDPDKAQGGSFRTPSLRHVSQTGPYMHEGQLATLEDVVTYYKTLPPSVLRRAPILAGIDRSISAADVAAFLRSLGGPLPASPWTEPPSHTR